MILSLQYLKEALISIKLLHLTAIPLASALPGTKALHGGR
jgi:hypothetical protein